MFRGEGVMQMAEMGDAQLGGLEHEDRVAVIFRPPAGAADIGRNLADAHSRTVRSWGAGPPRIPAPEDVRDGWIGPVAEMGGVRLVHRRHVRRDGRAGAVAVIRSDPYPLRRLDRKVAWPTNVKPTSSWRRAARENRVSREADQPWAALWLGRSDWGGEAQANDGCNRTGNLGEAHHRCLHCLENGAKASNPKSLYHVSKGKRDGSPVYNRNTPTISALS